MPVSSNAIAGDRAADRLYGIVDTARDPRLYGWVKQCAEHACLFAGEIKPPLDAASPYLVLLDDKSPLKEVWRTEGWGKAWGILCRSPLPLPELRRHLRKFLQAKLPDGDVVMFRFYDPRVWRVYWPTCTPEEQQKWLTGVTAITAEEEMAERA